MFQTIRQFLFLCVFQKTIERIMCNRLHLYWFENDLLYNKQLGFQKEYSTDRDIVQLRDQIHDI